MDFTDLKISDLSNGRQVDVTAASGDVYRVRKPRGSCYVAIQNPDGRAQGERFYRYSVADLRVELGRR